MKKLLTFLTILCLVSATFFTGCPKPEDVSDNTDTVVELIEGKTYRNQISTYNQDEMGNYIEAEKYYDTDLFFRNDIVAQIPDPGVIQCTDKGSPEYGYFFLFGTEDMGFNAYRSDDLVNWKSYGMAYLCEGWEYESTWAPEVVYDKDADPEKYGLEKPTDGSTGCYFFIYSASPSSDKDIPKNLMSNYNHQTSIAVATHPQGPYKLWTGKELGAVVGGIDYGTAEGYAIYTEYYDEQTHAIKDGYTGYVGRANDSVTKNDFWWNASAARAALKEKYGKAGNYWSFSEDGTNFPTIDASPFVDPKTGDKYLLVRNSTYDPGLVDDEGLPVKMGTSNYIIKTLNNDWTQLDYSSIEWITRSGYTFISEKAAVEYNRQAAAYDPTAFKDGCKETTEFHMETYDVEEFMGLNIGRIIEEGPQLNYSAESGLYYFTFSIGETTNGSYSVCQAVAYDIGGPYRKLSVSEGGVLSSNGLGLDVDVTKASAPGHHCLIEVGDDLLIIYHRQIDVTSGFSRGICVDRVKWVKNSDGLLIMHMNGPTRSIQPRLYCTGATPYDIISGEATVSVNLNEGEYTGLNYLNDELYLIHDFSQEWYTDKGYASAEDNYTGEFETDAKNFTITYKYDDYRDVTALMIYNSRDYEKSFTGVKKIEMDVLKDGIEGTYVINNLKFDFTFAYNEFNDSFMPGTSATAEFAEVKVKEIRVTFNNKFETLAIPEICVLGRPADKTTPIGTTKKDKLEPDPVSMVGTPFDTTLYNTYGDVTVDGVINEEEWAGQNKFEYDLLCYGGVMHHIEASSKFVDDGLIFYYDISGAPQYYNPSRTSTRNSCLELYIASGNATESLNWAFEVDLSPSGKVDAKKFLKPSSLRDGKYIKSAVPLDYQVKVDGGLNNPDGNGFTLEVYMPFTALDAGHMDYFCMNPAIIYTPDYITTNRDWKSVADEEKRPNAWLNPQVWYFFDQDGYMDPEQPTHVRINDGKGVSEGGTVTATGTPATGIDVNVTPNENYIIKSLIVNGKEYTSTSLHFGPNELPNVNVLVEFVSIKDVVFHDVEFTVKGGFYIDEPNGWMGSEIRFDGTIPSAAKVGENGKVTVSLADGAYKVSIGTGETFNVTVSNGKVVSGGTEFAFVKKLFDANSYITYNADGTANANGAGSKIIVFNNEVSLKGRYVEMRTFAPQISTPGYTVADKAAATIRMLDNKGMGLSWGIIEMDATFPYKFGVRWGLQDYTSKPLTQAQFNKFNDPEKGLRIGLLVTPTTVYGMCENDAGKMEVVLVKSFANAKISSISSDEPLFMIKDIKVIKNYESNVTLNGGSYVNGETVSLNGGSVKIIGFAGNKSYLYLTPDAGYGVKVATVDGKSISVPDYDKECVVSFDSTGLNMNVSVEFAPVSSLIPNDYEFTVKTAVAGSTPEIFTGNVSLFGNELKPDKDGKIYVTLFDGEYTVMADGTFPQTVSVNNGVADKTEILLLKNIFTSNPNFTYGTTEDGLGYTITSGICKQQNFLIKDLDVSKEITYYFTLNMHISAPAKTGLAAGTRFFPAMCMQQGSGLVQIQFSVWDGTLILKGTQDGNRVNSGNLIEPTTTEKVVNIDFKVVGNGNKFTFYTITDGVETEFWSYSIIGEKISGVGFRFTYDDFDGKPAVYDGDYWKITSFRFTYGN